MRDFPSIENERKGESEERDLAFSRLQIQILPDSHSQHYKYIFSGVNPGIPGFSLQDSISGLRGPI
jgi:hypothetical protein